MFANRIRVLITLEQKGVPTLFGQWKSRKSQFIWKGLDCPDHVQSLGSVVGGYHQPRGPQ